MIGALVLAATFTNTSRVESIAAAGATLWAATGGGVERYDLITGKRVRVYPIGPAVRIWSNDQNAQIAHARTLESECILEGELTRCTSAAVLAASVPSVAPLFHGARETARLTTAGGTVVATAGQGIWSNDQRLTPEGQICGNHVEALAEFRGHLWVGSFDDGLCVLEGDRFRTVHGPFRMINDLRATRDALYVASAEGLYVTRDGRRFRRERRIRERTVNHLAVGGRWLFATSPFALYAVRLDGRIVKRWRKPAGSTALQSVAVSGANLWLATEDTGVIRMRRGKFEAYDRAWGLPSSWTVDVAAAPDGGVWAATLRNGFVHLDANGRIVELGADQRAWGLRLYDDRGRMRFGTQHGLDGVPAEKLPDPHVHALLRTRDGLWVGTEGGLVLLDD
jgi:ligand-binding sensor domain-containing protein